jgi:hypothetical protein
MEKIWRKNHSRAESQNGRISPKGSVTGRCRGGRQGCRQLSPAMLRGVTNRKIYRKWSTRRFTFSRPICPDREIRFSSCGSASAFLFHEWRECYPLQASRFPGSLEGDRSDRVRFRQGRHRVSMPWRICRGSGERQKKKADIPFPSRYLPHANAPNAGAGHSCQCSFPLLLRFRACLTACRSSCADHSGPPASAPPAAW